MIGILLTEIVSGQTAIGGSACREFRKSRLWLRLVLGLAALLVILVTLGGCSADQSDSPSVADSSSRSIAENGVREVPSTAELVAELSLRQKAAQVLLVGFPEDALSTQNSTLNQLLQEAPPGGVILYGRNVGSPAELQELIEHLQRSQEETGAPALLVAVDQEGGPIRRIEQGVPALPSARTLGEEVDPSYARDLAAQQARALLDLGINTNLAPVADVVSDPASFLFERTYSADALEVSEYVAAAVAAQEEAGLISVVKHFPGHGAALGDTHEGIARAGASLEEIRDVHLVPFSAAIAAGVPAVMVAHIEVPALGEDEPVPASRSSAVIQGLLREELGFQGVVITDDLEMGAVGDAAEAAVQSLVAGADLLILGHSPEVQLAALQSIETAVGEGRLAPARLDEAVTRVYQLKRDYGLLSE